MHRVVLYHATTQFSWGKITSDGMKIPRTDWTRFYLGTNRKKPGSLGYGAYGFLNDMDLARQFLPATTSGKDYVIIKITININPERCLNLVDDLADMKLLRDFLLEKWVKESVTILKRFYRNTFKQHSLDGALLEFFIRSMVKEGQFEQVDCICCATTTSLYPYLDTFLPNGIEHCIRNQEIIKGIVRSD
ncbi:hypothetical protein [Lentilactobacillus kisonensis]|uniref:hypothetical protein n=1 Tax=Lentilactobacillus kisonensis TaxID=481722 RepID=UPI0007056537|nr:hypothetical protein [Lentilactobacillus kisonensis]